MGSASRPSTRGKPFGTFQADAVRRLKQLEAENARPNKLVAERDLEVRPRVLRLQLIEVSAFAFFGGVPQSVLMDNTKLAVAKILADGRRELTTAFTRLISHYVFRERFGRPRKGNDKGKVEALVKFARRSHLTPVPRVASIDDLNGDLEAACIKRLSEWAGRERAPIGERLLADLAAFRQLDMGPFEACDVRTARVSSTALVRYRNVDYSVPTAYGHRDVTVKGFVDRMVISPIR